MLFHFSLSRCSPRNFKTMAGSPGGSSRTLTMGRTATKADTGKQERRDTGTGASTYLGNSLRHEHPVLAVAKDQEASTHPARPFRNNGAPPSSLELLLLNKKRGALHEEYWGRRHCHPELNGSRYG